MAEHSIFAVRLTYPNGDAARWSSVTRSASEPGWRWTWWGPADSGAVSEPYGHTSRATPGEAILAALRDGYLPGDVVGPDADEGLRLLAEAVEVIDARAREIEDLLAECGCGEPVGA